MRPSEGDDNRARLVARMVEHGATRVEMAKLMKEAQIVWRIGAYEDVSETCIHSEELMASGARSCRLALDVMTRMDRTDGVRDTDLLTALKKYVQDTCEAIKQVDNVLKANGSGLADLFFEIPDRSQDEMSWRDLIGRRDVIAHRLLTVDDERVHREAERDFGSLHKLLSRVYFAPVKTDFEADKGFMPMLKADAWRRLAPSVEGLKPEIGGSLIFVCEDKKEGFVPFRLGRSASNTVLLAAPPGIRRISIGYTTGST